MINLEVVSQDELKLYLTNLETTLVQGPQGEVGATGPAGPTGATGEAGPIGQQGVQGPQGPIGLTGPTGATGATGLQGATGATGAQGIQGAKGDTGDQGPQGIQGIQGSQGIQGEKGDKGDKGDTGDTGAPGADGGSSAFFPYTVKTTITTGDPGAGHGIWNTVGQIDATILSASHLDKDGDDVNLFLHLINAGDILIIQSQADSTQYQKWEATAGPTEFGTYDQIPVTYIEGGHIFSNNDVVMLAVVRLGAVGPQGPQGIQGEPGPTGATGAQGIQGIQGEQGIQGIQGEAGPQGIQGIQGDTGATGPQGETGATGATGAAGVDAKETAFYFTQSIDMTTLTVGGYVDFPYRPNSIFEPGIAVLLTSTNFANDGARISGVIVQTNGTSSYTIFINSIIGPQTISSWGASVSGIRGVPGAAGASANYNGFVTGTNLVFVQNQTLNINPGAGLSYAGGEYVKISGYNGNYQEIGASVYNYDKPTGAMTVGMNYQITNGTITGITQYAVVLSGAQGNQGPQGPQGNPARYQVNLAKIDPWVPYTNVTLTGLPTNLSYSGGETIKAQVGDPNGYISQTYYVYWYNSQNGEMGVQTRTQQTNGTTSGFTTLYGSLIGEAGSNGANGLDANGFIVQSTTPTNPQLGTVWVQI